MTPKEKAQELAKRFEDGLTIKDCALIAVDEIVNELIDKYVIVNYKYWNEVKHEIENI